MGQIVIELTQGCIFARRHRCCPPAHEQQRSARIDLYQCERVIGNGDLVIPGEPIGERRNRYYREPPGDAGPDPALDAFSNWLQEISVAYRDDVASGWPSCCIVFSVTQNFIHGFELGLLDTFRILVEYGHSAGAVVNLAHVHLCARTHARRLRGFEQRFSHGFVYSIAWQA